ncbi:ATP-binding protein [Calothrix rhizosoleniae]|uniref:ATP-binding protein n=1 Tax=Calothrix rhizosoleniae TaxID=888997 RepID=UPI000B49DDEF|nr:ATP-binding protein [Calothrix rhizosoleniae]
MAPNNISKNPYRESTNPFFVGGPIPPNKFVGRTTEINIAFDQIINRSHLAIWGSSRMGKSSLLQYLTSSQIWEQQGLDSELCQAIFVYVNCTSIQPFTPTEFWREMLRELLGIVKKNYGTCSWGIELSHVIDEILNRNEVNRSDLRTVLEKIGNHNKFLVLLLDDYDMALYSHDKYTETEMLTFLSEFRNLAVHSQEGEYLSTVVASSQPLNLLGPKITFKVSPWYNHYLFLPLKPFTLEETAEMFARMPTQLSLKPEQQKEVKKLTGGHPTLLETAGFLLYNNFRQGHKVIEKKFQEDFLNASQLIFESIWASCHHEEQLLLMLIVLRNLGSSLQKKDQFDLDCIEKILSQKERELFALEEQGVLQRKVCKTINKRLLRPPIEEKREIFVISSFIMEWWITQEIINKRDEIRLRELERTALGLSHDQAVEISNLIRWLWNNPNEIQHNVDWFSTLVATFDGTVGRS